MEDAASLLKLKKENKLKLTDEVAEISDASKVTEPVKETVPEIILESCPTVSLEELEELKSHLKKVNVSQ